MNSKIKAWYELLNPAHALIVLLGIVTGIKTAGGSLESTQLFFSAVLSFSIIAAAFILNDYWDLEADKENKRKDKPLVTGEISKTHALFSALAFLAIGNYASYLLNEKVFIISIIFTAILLAYNYYLKKVAFIGNATIGLTMAIPFIYGNYLCCSNLSSFVLILSSMAFLMGTGRELIASIRDKKGDEKQGRKTLPSIIGDEKTAWLSSFFILTAVFLSPLPLVMKGPFNMNPAYLIFITITDVLLILSIKNTLLLSNYKQTRKLTLLAQLTGVLGFLLATLI